MPAADVEAALAATEITPPSLAAEGFIHASEDEAQVVGVANRLYANVGDLAALVIDEHRVHAEIKRELAANGERYPHIYGPLERAAVVGVRRLRRGVDGRFTGFEADD